MQVEGAGVHAERLLGPGETDFVVDPAPSTAAAPLRSFALAGLRHVLTGWDHILFLIGLALAGRSLRRAAAETSVFTLAHALALGAASFGVFAPSARIVEPLIGLSIAFVAWEGFRQRSHSARRLAMIFGSGLLHGLGVAGGLRAVGPTTLSFGATLAFNGGVEVAQLAVVGLSTMLLAALRRETPFRRQATAALAGGLCVAGALLFVLRLRG